MILHVAVFSWRSGVTPEQVAEVGAALARMPATVGTIRSYEHGPDAGLGTPRWDYGVVADFDDEAAGGPTTSIPTTIRSAAR